jgi:4-oxalocrotonate tautomerase
MPLINVHMLAGRTPDQKRALIAALGEAAKRVLGVPEEALRIILTDVPPEHWGVGCRTMADVQAENRADEQRS